MSESHSYDVFFSHSTKDKSVVRELAERLKADGLRVWFDDWEIQPGDMIPRKIIEGLDQSRVLVLCMSASFFDSEWGMLESYTSLFRDPTNQERRFIPLRLDEAKIKDTLKQYAYIDWRQRSAEQYAKLLAACRPTVVAVESATEQKEKPQTNKVFTEHTDLVYGVAVTPDGRRALSCSIDKTVRVWDLQKGDCIATLEGHTDSVYGVAVTANGRRAVSSSKD